MSQGVDGSLSVSRRAVLLLALWCLSATILLASPIASISGLDISQVGGPHTDGSIFTFDFTVVSASTVSGEAVTGSSGFGYLNLISGGTWLIQNEPIPLVDALVSSTNYFWFDLGDGSLGASQAIINDTPFAGPPAPDGTWSAFVPALGVDLWGVNDPAGEEAALGPGPAPLPPPPVRVIDGFLRGGVPDMKQFTNECGPTSTANSMLWLIDKYDLPTDKLPKHTDGNIDQAALELELAKAMKPGWVPSELVGKNRGYPGLDRGEFEAGKKKFMKDKGLPVRVHGGVDTVDAQEAKAFDFTKKELKRGQDVEFLINWPGGGAHWVTVVGYIDNGKDQKTLIVHDPDHAKAGNHYWKLKDDGTFTAPRGTANRAVAESPVPEPSTWFLFLSGTALLGLARLRKQHRG